MDDDIKIEIENQIRQSIHIAWTKYPDISPFIKKYSQELNDNVIRKHIDLYVNEYSNSLGRTGRQAILQLLNIHQKLVTQSQDPVTEVFLTDAN